MRIAALRYTNGYSGPRNRPANRANSREAHPNVIAVHAKGGGRSRKSGECHHAESSYEDLKATRAKTLAPLANSQPELGRFEATKPVGVVKLCVGKVLKCIPDSELVAPAGLRNVRLALPVRHAARRATYSRPCRRKTSLMRNATAAVLPKPSICLGPATLVLLGPWRIVSWRVTQDRAHPVGVRLKELLQPNNRSRSSNAEILRPPGTVTDSPANLAPIPSA